MSDFIAWAALLFSGISLMLSIRTKRKQSQLIARQIEAHDREAEQAGRARVTARIEKEWRGARAQWKVVIHNGGPADARDVDLEFKEAQQLVPTSDLQRKLPLSVLSPGEEVRLIASVAMGSAIEVRRNIEVAGQ